MCYTLGLENNHFFGYTADMFVDRLSEMNISHSIYYTKGQKKIIIKVFADEEKRELLSELISEFIIENYCKKTALLYIDRYYHFFNDEEKSEILDRLFRNNEKDTIANLIMKYFHENDRLYPEGFASFRLGEFYECIDESVSLIVDEMLLNKEYMEFIRILRHFVSLNDSGVVTVNIYKPYHGNYILLDENNKKISGDTLRDITFEIAEEELSIQDRLLSDLVSLSPKLVVVHNKENFDSPQLVKTLEMVFEDNLVYCNGCDLCEKYFQK